MNKVLIIIIFAILLAGNIFLGVEYYIYQQQVEKCSEISQKNSNVVAFNKLFVEKILKMQGEVAPSDRLKLEYIVSSIGDSQFSEAWKSFLDSKTEEDAQKNVLKILSLIPEKIIY